MKPLDQIPKELSAQALYPAGLDEGQAAWTREDAIAVIDSLKGTTVAVSGVDVLTPVAWGYESAETAWSGDRLPNESDADYATRSRLAAREFIRDCDLEVDGLLFALTFPIWKDAA